MGLLSNLFGGGKPKPPKKQKPRIVTNGDWTVELDPDGTPTRFDHKGKEWLSTPETWASPGRAYFLHSGFDSKGDECLALTTQTEGLRVRKFGESVEAALVTDAGIGYVISDEGKLYTITAEKAGQKSLTEDCPEACLLTAEVAVAITDDGETVTIKAIDLTTGKAWKKAIKYEDAEELDGGYIRMAEIKETAGGIEITIPDGTVHSFTAAGTPLV